MRSKRTKSVSVILSLSKDLREYGLVSEILRRRSFHSLAQNDGYRLDIHIKIIHNFSFFFFISYFR